MLTVVDDFTKESLATVSDKSITGRRLVAELDKIIKRRSMPLAIFSNNGGEMTSRAVLQWTMETCIEWHYIAPGKPTQTAFIENINKKLHDACLYGSHRRCDQKDRGLAERRQHGPATQFDRQPNAGSLRCDKRPRDGGIAKRSNGRDASHPTGLRASLRCHNHPDRMKQGTDFTLKRMRSRAQASDPRDFETGELGISAICRAKRMKMSVNNLENDIDVPVS